MTKNRKIQITMLGLAVFAAGSIVYFNGLVDRFYDGPPPEAQIETNAGMTEQPGPDGIAQFRATCALNDGRTLSGTVSVPQDQTPATLETIEMRTDAGAVVQFSKTNSRCAFAPF